MDATVISNIIISYLLGTGNFILLPVQAINGDRKLVASND